MTEIKKLIEFLDGWSSGSMTSPLYKQVMITPGMRAMLQEIKGILEMWQKTSHIDMLSAADKPPDELRPGFIDSPDLQSRQPGIDIKRLAHLLYVSIPPTWREMSYTTIIKRFEARLKDELGKQPEVDLSSRILEIEKTKEKPKKRGGCDPSQ